MKRKAVQPASNNNINNKRPPDVKEFFDGRIEGTVPLVFREQPSYVSEKFPMQAVYIQSFDEIFTCLSPAEALFLLFNINTLAAYEEIVFYFDIPSVATYSVDDCIQQIDNYLKNQKNNIKKHLLNQRKKKIDFNDFQIKCESKHIQNVYIGGVYGRACVSNAGRRIAKSIYTKQLGDQHLNIRFVDTDNPFRFENAIVWPAITEGYLKKEATFDNFFLFPETRAFSISWRNPSHYAQEQKKIENDDPYNSGVEYDKAIVCSEQDQGKLHQKLFKAVLGSKSLFPNTNNHNAFSNYKCVLFNPRKTEINSSIPNSSVTHSNSQSHFLSV